MGATAKVTGPPGSTGTGVLDMSHLPSRATLYVLYQADIVDTSTGSLPTHFLSGVMKGRQQQ